MGIVGRSGLAVLGLLVATPVVHAARCTDTSGFAAALQAVEAAVPCDQATKRKKYVKAAKKAVPKTLSKACRKAFTKQFIVQSTCGRRGFVVCCDTNRKGKNVSKVKKAKKCKAALCDNGATSVGEGCTPQGTCVTTTTTTTTAPPTTTQPTSTTTTSTIPPARILDFTLALPGGPCGEMLDGASVKIRDLTCGGLNIGGGASTVAEGPTPDGSVSRFGLDCTGSTCAILPFSQAPAENTAGPDCTDLGCNFGTPLPVPNVAQPNLSTCVLNTWSAPASGSLDLDTGVSTTNVPLASDVFLTSNAVQACPRCSATGTPASPGIGTCDRGPRTGLPCTTTSSTGLTRDCPTGGADATHPCTPGGGQCIDGAHVGPIAVDLSPLTTGTASRTAADGVFCDGQLQAGCFGSTACRSISENGSPAGPIMVGTPASATLASVFCIAATGNGIVDGAASLPGPGAVSLPGNFLITDLSPVTTTTVAPTSTSTTVTTTSSTTTTTLQCGNGTVDPGEECDPNEVDGMGCPGDQTCDPNNCQCVAVVRTLDFTTGLPGGTCGNTQDGSAVVIKNLTCGGLNIGGGASIVPEGPTPDGSVSRFSLDCTGSTCDILPFNTAPGVNTADPDCTNTGCNFGTPLPIPNPAIPTITTCVLNTWQAPASGTLNLATGVSTTSVPLNSDIYLTGNLAQPCPRCVTGTCDRGPRAGLACTTTSSTGVTRDCPTGGANPPGQPCTPGGGACIDGSHVGVISVNLTPLTTGTATDTDAGGLFCPGQGAAQVGCFGSPACRTITENGDAAGQITAGTPADATLASVFCIAATGNGLVDASANLPGPGAVSLPGTFVVTETPVNGG